MVKKTYCVCLALMVFFATMFCRDLASIEQTVATATITGHRSVVVTETIYEVIVEQPKHYMTVVATAYCSCRECCGVYAENRPNGIVYTASGAVAKANHTIAVDTSVIPFGTQVRYGDTVYTAEDTGSAIIGNRIDIYYDSHEDALEWGRRTIEIEVIV